MSSGMSAPRFDHLHTYDELTTELGEDAVAVAVPALARGAHDMDGLMHIATILMEKPK